MSWALMTSSQDVTCGNPVQVSDLSASSKGGFRRGGIASGSTAGSILFDFLTSGRGEPICTVCTRITEPAEGVGVGRFLTEVSGIYPAEASEGSSSGEILS